MKKSELTQLTQIIECLVTREVRKQLPSLIAETVQNLKEQTIVTEDVDSKEEPLSVDPPINDFKASLRELFEGTTVMRRVEESPKKIIQYAKDPIINQILNETKSDLRSRERPVGAAAVHGGYSLTFDGGNDGGNRTNVESPLFASPAQPIVEGMETNHTPMANIPSGTSVLDIARQVPAPAVKQALTRNYSEMMKLIDKKRGKV